MHDIVSLWQQWHSKFQPT